MLTRLDDKAGQGRLTTHQRLQALEREVVVLYDMIRILHNLTKNQGALINEFITNRITDAEAADNPAAAPGRPEKQVYTFVCRQRFDRLERNIQKALRSIEDMGYAVKAG